MHFFAEFNRPVDWTTLRPVIFGGITPNAQPTRARGPRTREAMDQGHFYCYAQKALLSDFFLFPPRKNRDQLGWFS